MLCLAPIELVTDAERRLLRVLDSFGVGSRVLGGLVVFLPVVDGAMQRRQADAVVFMPETVVVVRALGMGKQSGELRPSKEGAWTLGTEVLRLQGGGSSPVTQLRRAVELVGATLSADGLDPGALPSLAALDGGVTSVHHRSAAGPVACAMDAGDLLTGLRHAASQGAQGDRRVWTTADVKAALSAFGLQTRGPSVEELNNEGFLYSPYVLRRLQPARPGPRPVFVPPTSASGSIAVVSSAVLPPEDDGDVPGARVSQEQSPREEGPQDRVADALDEMLDAPAPSTPRRTPQERPRRVWVGRVAAVAAVVLLLALAGVAGVRYALDSGLDSPGEQTAQGGTPTPTATVPTTASAAPSTPSEQTVDGQTYTLQARQKDVDCGANSYGQVSEYFVTTPCAGLTRAIFRTTIDGATVLVSVSIVEMPDDAQAAELRTLVDSTGTGNVSDLLRSGIQIEGAPAELLADSYASQLDGSAVRVVEAAWQAEVGSDADLEAVADAALTLDLPQA